MPVALRRGARECEQGEDPRDLRSKHGLSVPSLLSLLPLPLEATVAMKRVVKSDLK